jgi:hypothetical protein
MRTFGLAALAALALFLAALSLRPRAADSRPVFIPALRPVEPPPPAEPPTPEAPAPKEEPAPKAPPSPRAAEAPAPRKEALRLGATQLRAAVVDGALTAHWIVSEPEESLGLTEAQKAAIDAIRNAADVERLDLERRTQAAIRAVLTPEQIAKRNAAEKASFAVEGAPSQPPGYLGISGDTAPGGGVRVTSVTPDSAAGRFGLREGDVILQFNGQPIHDFAALAQRVRETGEGFAATMRIRRDGVELDHAVQLGARPK